MGPAGASGVCGGSASGREATLSRLHTGGFNAPLLSRRCWSRLCVVVALVAAGMVSPLVIAVSPAAAYSALLPPRLCSTGAIPCIQQPIVGGRGYDGNPVKIDMPTFRRETVDVHSLYNGEVTFSISDPGTAPAGYALRPPLWNVTIALTPIDAEPGASLFYMQQKDSCDGRPTCTYVSTASDMKSGWYKAGDAVNLTLVYQQACPPSLNLVQGCTATESESAVYVPQLSEKAPPLVRMATAGAGLTTKAIAIAFDPYGEPLSLSWDFGDGSAQVPGTLGSVIAHTYAEIGDYQVTARVLTADGRNQVSSLSSRILPPKPRVLAFSMVPPPNNGVPAVASGLVQGWPAGAVAIAHMWDTGCPSDPTSVAARSSQVSSSFVAVASDGSINIALGFVQPGVNAVVIEATTYLSVGGRGVLVDRISDCFTAIGAATPTAAPTLAGATEIPVDASSVPIGDIALIDSGTQAERRLVTGHGSLIVAPLTSAHPAGVPVVDLGAPLPAYVVPPPPADPPPPSPFVGTVPAGASYVALVPARLLDTRTDPSSSTVDGQGLGAGLAAAGSVTEIQVTGRAGVPADAAAVALNVTVTDAQAAGYVTVFPCGSPRPTASTLNFVTGSTIPNGAIAKIGVNGKVCLYANNATDLIADVTGYFPASQ